MHDRERACVNISHYRSAPHNRGVSANPITAIPGDQHLGHLTRPPTLVGCARRAGLRVGVLGHGLADRRLVMSGTPAGQIWEQIWEQNTAKPP